MKSFDRVLRHLADSAIDPAGRTWPSVDAVADAVGVPRATAGRVMLHLRDIGAARWLAGSGAFEVCAPERAVDVYKVRWSRSRAHIGYAPREAVADAVRDGRAVWGGCDAAVHHLDGLPAVMGAYAATTYVLDAADVPTHFDRGDGDVDVYLWGGPGPLPDDGHATLTQTVAELFNTPGWQADENYRALYFRHIMPIQGDVNA